LILEALKKLEREKQTPERGFLVVGMAPWSSSEGRSTRVLLILLAIAASAGLYAWVAHAPAVPRPEAASSRLAPAPPAQAAAAAPLPAVTPPPQEAGPGFPGAPRPAPAAPTPRAAAPASQPGGPPKSLVLTAISQKDGKPIAVLNDHFVREGDSFDGVRIVRIGETEVEVEVDGRRTIVTF
jgi:hypothetical protein